MRHISILGSTGSIGTQTLDVVRTNRDILVEALAAGSNISLLLEQIKEFQPKLVCVYHADKAKELEEIVKKEQLNVEITTGMDGLLACATISSTDMVVTAFVGMIGIRPTIEAIKAGKHIALANKETLVTAGHIIMPLAKEKGVSILPVDSEHSAIFQSLQGNVGNKIHRILLTASGGPFRGKTKEELKSVQVEDALKHPNWSMGRKITIDSSTLVNKGLEVIEAKWLFDASADQIEVVVHPQSIVHSMIEYEDGAVIAQLGTPDMKLPIQYALYYPERKGPTSARLNFAKLRTLEFYEPDTEVFPALTMAYEALRTGGSMPTVYNATNEWAVASFLDRKIGYTDIVETIRKEMEAHQLIKNPSLEEILATEAEVYRRLNR
ncbi:MAG: 1-deoxy-D-xylulose-5-phosphate reductoisomerase [Lachnospiraceae bacterium]|nr:1-deoxy-D-xylulose-5-phosphate reductoisomerase [Lachnospiraceae bacterium]MBP3570249.1 1-deoxy-D-xylulose-5-phosphate reductoisomerase [Lachnospiraceae bacterium]